MNSDTQKKTATLSNQTAVAQETSFKGDYALVYGLKMYFENSTPSSLTDCKTFDGSAVVETTPPNSYG